MNDSLRTTLVADDSELAQLAPQWDALGGDLPFRGFHWANTWWRHYRDARSELFILVAHNQDGELVGIAPWYVSRLVRAGRVVRFLGSGEVCSDYLTLLCRPEWRGPFADKVADWLASEGAGRWSFLDLAGVEASDPAIEQLQRRLAEHGHDVERRADESCWRLTLPATWKEYLATLSQTRRDRSRKLLRKVIDNGRAGVHLVGTQDELDRAFEVLIDLHQRRRRALGEKGCFASERFTRFHREIAGHFLAVGQLRMLWIELDSRPVAAEYAFVSQDTIYYYQGGFDPDSAHESPGIVTLALNLRSAIEAGFKSFDFLRGDEAYKASWRAKAVPLVRVRIVGKQTSAKVRHATWRAAQRVKGWAKQILPRQQEAVR